MSSRVSIGAAASILLLAGCADSQTATGPGSVTVTTTNIGGADIVTPGRAFDSSCGKESAPDPSQSDVARIAVTDPTLLDPICALGLQKRVVAVVGTNADIPRYLGPAVTSLPTIGTSPSEQQARQANANVTLTRNAAQAAPFRGQAIVVDPKTPWQDQFRKVADQLGRHNEGARRLATFANDAARIGKRVDATHSQVSLVRFSDNSESIEGTESYAGSILAAIGAQRPATQRKPGSALVNSDSFKAADGDMIYVSFSSDAGQKFGVSVMRSDRWLDLGAPNASQVKVVDDSYWYGNRGLAAAPIVLDDLTQSLR